jgi:hypothetical protein
MNKTALEQSVGSFSDTVTAFFESVKVFCARVWRRLIMHTQETARQCLTIDVSYAGKRCQRSAIFSRRSSSAQQTEQYGVKLRNV